MLEVLVWKDATPTGDREYFLTLSERGSGGNVLGGLMLRSFALTSATVSGMPT